MISEIKPNPFSILTFSVFANLYDLIEVCKIYVSDLFLVLFVISEATTLYNKCE